MTQKVLVIAPTNLGDSIMALPAVRFYQQRSPDDVITILARPGVFELWIHFMPDCIVQKYETSIRSTIELIRILRRERFTKVFVLPESFRSGFIGFAAGARARIGISADFRNFLINQRVTLPATSQTWHRSRDYQFIVNGRSAPETTEEAFGELIENWTKPSDLAATYVGLFPGAGRGNSKMWPIKRYIEFVGRILRQDFGANVKFLVFGSVAENALGEAIQKAYPDFVGNFCGQTSLNELIEKLRSCSVVVANDCGGMHLASAVGTPVVAIFGRTDPMRTGPLGPMSRVLQKSEFRSERIGKTSKTARQALERITADEVFDAVREFL